MAPRKWAKPERNEQIASLWENGATMPEIARRFGIGATRVRKILLRYFDRVKEPRPDFGDGGWCWVTTRQRIPNAPINERDAYRMTYSYELLLAKHGVQIGPDGMG
ncbi:hypothetical protein GAY31_19520 [Azospirillum brasilense]|nr:hypothetical protein [Azospirillum brasilense]